MRYDRAYDNVDFRRRIQIPITVMRIRVLLLTILELQTTFENYVRPLLVASFTPASTSF